MRRLLPWVMLAMAGTGAASASAQDQSGKEVIISDASNAGWTFDGNPKLKEIDAAMLPGKRGIAITIPAKGANPWDIQAQLPMKQGVAAGDTVTFGFYARAARPDPGKDSATVAIRIQRNAAPYDAAVESAVEVGPNWRFHCVGGPARIALTPAELVVSVQLAHDKRVIEVGPYIATRIPGGGARTGLPCGEEPGGD